MKRSSLLHKANKLAIYPDYGPYCANQLQSWYCWRRQARAGESILHRSIHLCYAFHFDTLIKTRAFSIYDLLNDDLAQWRLKGWQVSGSGVVKALNTGNKRLAQ